VFTIWRIFKMAKQLEVKFKCRNCGHNRYTTVTRDNGLTGSDIQRQTLYHICKGCSVMFSNPDKFSVNAVPLLQEWLNRHESPPQDLEEKILFEVFNDLFYNRSGLEEKWKSFKPVVSEKILQTSFAIIKQLLAEETASVEDSNPAPKESTVPLLQEWLDKHGPSPQDLAIKILSAMFTDLFYDRVEFDILWENTSDNIKEEILKTNLAIIQRLLPEDTSA
jgi:Pyruvate/2-oxoacid:ferredoxin oxidoreductase delta subunit